MIQLNTSQNLAVYNEGGDLEVLAGTLIQQLRVAGTDRTLTYFCAQLEHYVSWADYTFQHLP